MASAQDSTSARPTGHAARRPHVSPYLELPAELRDAIYDLTFTYDERPRRHRAGRLHVVKGLPQPENLGICRQIRNEYLSRTKEHLTMMLPSDDAFQYHARAIKTTNSDRLFRSWVSNPVRASGIGNLEVWLAFGTDVDASSEVRLGPLLEIVKRCENLKSVKIGITLYRFDQEILAPFQKKIQDEWTTIPHLYSIRLYPREKRYGWFDGLERALMEWTKEGGKFEKK